MCSDCAVCAAATHHRCSCVASSRSRPSSRVCCCFSAALHTTPAASRACPARQAGASCGLTRAPRSYLVDLLPASIFFLAASALFVVALGLDIRQIRDQAEVVKRSAHSYSTCALRLRSLPQALTCPDPDVGALLARNAWRRWLALALNSAGGVVSVRVSQAGKQLPIAPDARVQFLGAVTYLRASAEVVNYHGEEELLRRGDALFATGLWLFCAGFALIVHDTRHTVVAISRIKGVRKAQARSLVPRLTLCVALRSLCRATTTRCASTSCTWSA